MSGDVGFVEIFHGWVGDTRVVARPLSPKEFTIGG
jgi:hypothetical protein